MRCADRQPMGFTLVELLVVIAVIVLLLSMLTPALDRAVYQAELAVDGARQRAAAGGLLAYAFDHRRSYPQRIGVASEVSWNPSRLALGRTHQSGRTRLDYLDERPALAGYIQINATLNDPFCRSVDLETTNEDPTIFAAYGLWYGWRFNAERGMYKVGDRFSWTYNDERAGRVRTWSFSLLIGDFDGKTVSTATYQASHPDALNVLFLRSGDNAPGTAQGGSITYAWWTNAGINRGDYDMNYTYDDASVVRFNDVIDKDARADGDPRMVHVLPGSLGAPGWPNTRLYLPRQ